MTGRPRVVFTPGSITGVVTARKRYRCDSHLTQERHYIEPGQRYAANALPPDHPDVGNARWLHLRVCLDCCPAEHDLRLTTTTETAEETRCVEASYADLVAERDRYRQWNAEARAALAGADGTITGQRVHIAHLEAVLTLAEDYARDAGDRAEAAEAHARAELARMAGPEQYVVLNDADYDERYSTRGEALEMAAALAADQEPAHRWRAYRLLPLAATPPADTALRTGGETLNEVAADSGSPSPEPGGDQT